jgi:hypothetical protein
MDYAVFFIVFVKFIFLCSAVLHLTITILSLDFDAIDEVAVYWKEKSEFVFKISMAILMIYSFHPFRPPQNLSKEIKLLLYLFGFIIIFTSDWKNFVQSLLKFEVLGDFFD